MLVTNFFQSQSRISSYRILVNNMIRVFTNFCHCLHRKSCIRIKSCNCSIWQSSWQHTHLHSPCLVPPGNTCCHKQKMTQQTQACYPFCWKPVFPTCYNYSISMHGTDCITCNYSHCFELHNSPKSSETGMGAAEKQCCVLHLGDIVYKKCVVLSWKWWL